MATYNKKRMATSDGSVRFYYVKVLSNGKSKRINKAEYDKHTKSYKGGAGDWQAFQIDGSSSWRVQNVNTKQFGPTYATKEQAENAANFASNPLPPSP